MKRLTIIIAIAAAAIFTAFAPSEKPMQRLDDGTWVVNTTTIGANIKGYKGATPVEVYIKKDRVEKVVILPNKETPKYLSKVKSSLSEAWNGKKVDEAKKLEPDGCTGATYTSRAVKENVKVALEYYKNNK